jgi:hypothetical protein
MSYGEHWERRAFGPVTPDLRQRILAWRPAAPVPWQVEDLYLYTPGCTVNVKLRAGELKLKRLLARDAELERWLEDPAEVWPLPLAPDVVGLTATALGAAAPDEPSQPLDTRALLDWLRQAAPRMQPIAVRKTRYLRYLFLPGVIPDVLLELADIDSPQATATVAVEHPQVEPVRRACALLGLDATPLIPMGYMQALALWARGDTLPTTRQP